MPAHVPALILWGVGCIDFAHTQSEEQVQGLCPIIYEKLTLALRITRTDAFYNKLKGEFCEVRVGG
jgi:hypothetical protein